MMDSTSSWARKRPPKKKQELAHLEQVKVCQWLSSCSKIEIKSRWVIITSSPQRGCLSQICKRMEEGQPPSMLMGEGGKRWCDLPQMLFKIKPIIKSNQWTPFLRKSSLSMKTVSRCSSTRSQMNLFKFWRMTPSKIQLARWWRTQPTLPLSQQRQGNNLLSNTWLIISKIKLQTEFVLLRY